MTINLHKVVIPIPLFIHIVREANLTNRMSPSSAKRVECIMCARTLRVRLLGNHLMIQHKVGRDQVDTVAKMHLGKKYK